MLTLQSWTRRRRELFAPATPTRFSVLAAVLLAVGLALCNAVALVQAVNLYHALAIGAPLRQALALRHGQDIFALEQRLHLAVEPIVQRWLSQDVRTPFGILPALLLRRCVVWIYLHALPAWLFAALAWSYLYKQRHFAMLRDVTVVSILLAVACYRLFPAAPPRFVLHGAPYNLADWTYGGTSIDPGLVHAVGFNPYAAFPSVHALWALIPALCIAAGSRRIWVWAAALCYPLAMLVIVVASGNHYVLDCVGSLTVLAVSYLLVGAVHRWGRRIISRRRKERYELPAALGLSVCCAGMLAVAGAAGGVRVYIAAAIIVLILYASGRSPYLWQGRRLLGDGRQVLRRCDYLAGWLFIAGATGAAAEPGQHATFAVRVCAMLWLFASMAALYRHVTARRSLLQRGYDGGLLRRPPWGRNRI